MAVKPDVIKIDTADTTIDIDDTAYDFDHCVSFDIVDPRENTVLSSPQGKGDGIIIQNNLTAPATINGIYRNIPAEVLKMLHSAWLNKKRIRVTIFDTESGRMVRQENAVIQGNPYNCSVAEGEGNFNVSMNTHSSAKNMNTTFQAVE